MMDLDKITKMQGVPVSKTLSDPARMARWVEMNGVLTGSNCFYPERLVSDYDYIVRFSDMYAARANYDMAVISNNCGYGNAFGNFKFEYEGKNYDLIIVGDAEFDVWNLATVMFPRNRIPRRDKARRVALFEQLKSVARKHYGYPEPTQPR